MTAATDDNFATAEHAMAVLVVEKWRRQGFTHFDVGADGKCAPSQSGYPLDDRWLPLVTHSIRIGHFYGAQAWHAPPGTTVADAMHGARIAHAPEFTVSLCGIEGRGDAVRVRAAIHIDGRLQSRLDDDFPTVGSARAALEKFWGHYAELCQRAA